MPSAGKEHPAGQVNKTRFTNDTTKEGITGRSLNITETAKEVTELKTRFGDEQNQRTEMNECK